MSFTILHISDVHITASNKPKVRERISAIQAVCAKLNVQPDAIVFSGDATQSAAEGQFSLFGDEVVAPLLSGLRLSPDRFFIVPGNHDVDRSVVDRVFQRGAEADLGVPDVVDDLWRDVRYRENALSRLKTFRSFVESNGLASTPAIVQHTEGTVGFVPLLSVWLSWKDRERNGLVISRVQFDEAIERLGTADVVVASWHHPIDWLHDSDAVRIRERMFSRLNLCLTGHLHEELGLSILSPQGQCYALAAPALCSSDAPNGFLIHKIDLRRREIQVTALRWSDKQTSFILNNEFAENGVWAGPVQNRGSLPDKALVARHGASESARAEAERRLLQHLPPVTMGRQLSAIDRFLEPQLVEIKHGKDYPTTLASLLSTKSCFLVEGQPQSGKTALLDVLQVRMNSGGTVAVRVAVEDIPLEATKSSLQQTIATTLNISKKAAAGILSGPCSLLIDDIDVLRDPLRWKTLQDWAADNDRLQIIATERPSPVSAAAMSQSTSVWRRVGLRPFSYQRMKAAALSMARKSGSSEGPQSLEIAIANLLDAELPRWPWVVLLAAELAARGSGNAISSLTSLINRFVSMKMDVPDPTGRGQRQRIRSRMLGVFAAELMKRRAADLSYGELADLFDDEIGKAGVDEDGAAVLHDLVRVQLLARQGESVSFSFFVLQEYFYAIHLRETVWDAVGDIDDDALIRKGGALAFLAELVELPSLLQRCIELTNAIAPIDIPVLNLDGFGELAGVLGQRDPDAVVAAAKNDALPDDKVETFMTNAERDRSGTRRLRVQRGKDGLESLGHFLGAFETTVSVLRGSLWIAKEAKVDAVRTVVEFAVRIASGLAQIEELLESLFKDWEDIKHRDNAGWIVNLILVTIVGSVLSQLGNAQHLTMAIREALDTESDDLRRLLLFMWYAEIGGADAVDLVRKISSELKGLLAVMTLDAWLYLKFIRSMTFGNANISQIEAAYRLVVEEGVRRSSSSQTPSANVRATTDKIVQEARRRRDSPLET